MDPTIASLTRRAQRVRHLPSEARCEACGTDQHVSPATDGTLRCYACKQAARGVTTVERDHVAGRANLGGLLVDLRAADHRTVTEMRLALGLDAWPLASGDPLLVLAHVLAGIASLLVLLGDWLVRAVAEQGPTPPAPAFPVVA